MKTYEEKIAELLSNLESESRETDNEKMEEDLRKFMKGGGELKSQRYYDYYFRCPNCQYGQTAKVPKGVLLKDFINNLICTNCECKI